MAIPLRKKETDSPTLFAFFSLLKKEMTPNLNYMISDIPKHDVTM